MSKSPVSFVRARVLKRETMAEDFRRKTPLMGWASWNCFRTNINEEKLKRQFDAMISTGLAECGYVYANTDDGFFGGRGADGKIRFHKERFPNGIKPLADYAPPRRAGFP